MNRPVRATAPNESAALLHSFTNHLLYSLAKDQYSATALDRYMSLALTVRDRLIERWISTQQRYYRKDAKRVYYLSAEFLMGRALANNLINLGIYEWVKQAIAKLGLDIEDLLQQEEEPGLGNGGGSSNSIFSCPVRCRTCCASARSRRFRRSASTRSSRSK